MQTKAAKGAANMVVMIDEAGLAIILRRGTTAEERLKVQGQKCGWMAARTETQTNVGRRTTWRYMTIRDSSRITSCVLTCKLVL